MRFKWTATNEKAQPALEKTFNDRIRTDLERRGVSPQIAERISLRVEDRSPAPGSDEYESLLDGISMAAAAQEDGSAEMSEQLRDLQDIERMMSGFSKELSKLDEVLEVLAAHVRKMRATAPPVGERILH